MANPAGNGIQQQSRLRAIYSKTPVAGGTPQGVGIQYGNGNGRVRLNGITYSYVDYANGVYLPGSNTGPIGRVIAINGNYTGDATLVTFNTSFTGFDVIFDCLLQGTDNFGPEFINLSYCEDTQTDPSLPLTVILAGLAFQNAAALPGTQQIVGNLNVQANIITPKTHALGTNPPTPWIKPSQVA